MKSAEEGYYLDPGSIATDDEEGLLKDQSRTNSDNFFDIAEGRGTDSGSKDSNKQDNTKYVQLSNFSGLNSPSLTSIGRSHFPLLPHRKLMV